MTEQKTLSCVNCSREYKVYPPDDLHNIVFVKKCDTCLQLGLEKWVETYLECEDCNYRNTLYWHSAGGHTESEIKRADHIRFLKQRIEYNREKLHEKN